MKAFRILFVVVFFLSSVSVMAEELDIKGRVEGFELTIEERVLMYKNPESPKIAVEFVLYIVTENGTTYAAITPGKWEADMDTFYTGPVRFDHMIMLMKGAYAQRIEVSVLGHRDKEEEMGDYKLLTIQKLSITYDHENRFSWEMETRSVDDYENLLPQKLEEYQMPPGQMGLGGDNI